MEQSTVRETPEVPNKPADPGNTNQIEVPVEAPASEPEEIPEPARRIKNINVPNPGGH